MPGDPVLHAEDDVGKPGVEAGRSRGIRLAARLDLPKQSAPAELQADGEVRAEVLRGADAARDLVPPLFLVQVIAAQVGVPVRRAVRHEVHHRGARERGGGVEVGRVPLEERPVRAPHRFRSEEAPARVVRLDLELHGFIEHRAVIVVVHRAAALLAFRLRGLRSQ